MAPSAADVLSLYDNAPLTPRYWATLVLIYAQAAFEFFDYFLVGYLVAVLAGPWHLTYGQSAIMLLSAGIGAIIGSIVWGRLADAWGRKRLLVLGSLIYPVAAGCLALIPDGAWVLFAALRFLVGLGMAGAITSQVPLLVEVTPTRHRPVVTGGMVIPVALGVLLAALSAATLLDLIGWRGIAALGALPLLSALAIALIVPESVRWLLAHNRFEEARAIVAGWLHRPVASISIPTARPLEAPKAPFRELYRNKVRFWQITAIWTAHTTVSYCVVLWAPTILALRLDIPVKEAAHYYEFVAIAGILGRTLFTFMPLWTGRRVAGMLMGYIGAVGLLAAGLFNGAFIGPLPAFIVILVATMFFFDGGVSNNAPYSAEIFPVQLMGRATGLAQACNGVGKILGPLILAMIAGSSNLISPKATTDAVLPAFIVMAICSLVCALAYTLVPTERSRAPLMLSLADEEGLASATGARGFASAPSRRPR
ncbi:MAG: MFS transporter [Alphaproteobacteria bacterium]|nr:MFS transporter [Alphaproteobacteria bacterium]